MPNPISESLSTIAAPAPRKIFLPPLPGMETEVLPIPEVHLESFDPGSYLNTAPTVPIPALEETTVANQENSTQIDNNPPESVVESFDGLSTDIFTPLSSDVSSSTLEDTTFSPATEESQTIIVEDFGIPSDLFNVPVGNNIVGNEPNTQFSDENDNMGIVDPVDPTSSTNLDNFFATSPHTQNEAAVQPNPTDPTSQMFDAFTPNTPGPILGETVSEESTDLPSFEETPAPTFTPSPLFENSFAGSPVEDTPQAAPTPELLGFDPSKYLSGAKSSAAPSLGISANDLPTAQGVSAPAPAPAMNSSEDYAEMQNDNQSIFTKDINAMEEIATPEAAPTFEQEEEHSNSNDTMQILRELSVLKELF